MFQLFLMRILQFAAVAILCCAPLRLSATDYYIDYANGADGNDGTGTTSAWRHCPGDPAATGRAAAAVLSGGDRVRFKGGVTYVLTAAPGIELRWDGAADGALVYDGNDDGTWGTGRARFTDLHSDKGITAFRATGPRRHLVLRALDIGPIGGAAQPPADLGGAVAARFGSGIGFPVGVENTLVERCAFHELGYWFNAPPMSTASIAGAGIAGGASVDLQVRECTFARTAIGCDFTRATRIDQTRILRCSFGSALVWPIDLPRPLQEASALQVSECDVAADASFGRGAWLGYGEAPQTTMTMAAAGGTVTWTVSALGSPQPSFQWLRNGTPLPGATTATLRLTGVAVLDSGVYTAVASNSSGSTVSNVALLVVLPNFLLSSGGNTTTTAGGSVTVSPPPSVTNVVPSFTLHPVNQLVTRGLSVTLSVAAAGTPAPTLQWLRNGSPLNGATGTALALPSVTSNDAGNYAAVATNAAGVATSGVATVTVLEPAPPPPPSPEVLPPSGTGASAVLAATLVTAGEPAASVEFTVPGATPRSVLVRAVGPTLAAFRLLGPLANPRLEIYRDGTRVGENDDWGGNVAVRNAAGAVTVFPLTDGASADAALVLTLTPGNYRATVSGGSGASGLVWVDAYALP